MARSGTRSRATSVGAPVTTTSWPPSARLRRRCRPAPRRASARPPPPPRLPPPPRSRPLPRRRTRRRGAMTTETIDDVLGAPIKRREDPRFITGEGNYLDDIKLASMAYVAVLRSPYAHANIGSINTSAASQMPGVLAVITGADIPYNPLPMAWPAGGSSGIQNNINTPRTLATDSVKWTGEGVAAVVAETEAQAYDAIATIEVDWEPLPAVVDA